MCILRILEKREKEIENLFEEIMAENFPNLWKETDSQVRKCKDFQTRRTKDTHTKTHYNQNGKIKDK